MLNLLRRMTGRLIRINPSNPMRMRAWGVLVSTRLSIHFERGEKDCTDGVIFEHTTSVKAVNGVGLLLRVPWFVSL